MVICVMPIAHSRVTAQGQISIPAKVRQRLGVGPGSVLEWDEEGGQVVVRKAGRHTSEEVHRALFPDAPRSHTLDEIKEGIREHVRRRRARR